MTQTQLAKVVRWLLAEGKPYVTGGCSDYGLDGGPVGHQIFGVRIGKVKMEMGPNGSIFITVERPHSQPAPMFYQVYNSIWCRSEDVADYMQEAREFFEHMRAEQWQRDMNLHLSLV